MSLIGLSKRSSLCKICTCIQDDTILNNLNLDILIRGKTHEEVIKEYIKYIPDIAQPLSVSNIINHKRHCDPALIAKDVLERRGQAVTEGDHAAIMYAERFQGVIDKKDTLHALYKARINSIQFLRDLLVDKQKEYSLLKLQPEDDYKTKSKTKVLEGEIRGLIKQIDDIEGSLQGVVIQDIRVEKGPGNTYVNQNILNIESNLKDFLNEIVPYLLYKVFPNDIDKGKEVVAHLSGFMDKHLTPTIKRLEVSKN